jgi:hypothetical protein
MQQLHNHSRQRGGSAGLAGLILVLAVVTANPAARAQTLTATDVARAIESGTTWLKNEQKANGRWSTIPPHTGGVDSLATLALLLAGVDKQDPAIIQSLRYLNSLDPVVDKLTVYTVSLMTMVYAEADPDLYRSRIRKCCEYLVEAQNESDPFRGGWAYDLRGGNPDGSNSQFAILALSEAARAGVKVDQAVWQRARWYWERKYKGSGRFIYREDSHHRTVATGSMVCAAIASLIIIDENLGNQPPLQNGRIACCVDEERLELVEAANRWMAANFTTRSNPADAYSIFRDNRYYYLYSMERAARLSGQRFFGKFDWYREGARTLIALQRPNGRWESSRGHGEENVHVATSLALLFLSKGRRPVVIGKYQHSDDNDWDRHRKGVHYLIQSLEKDWEVKLSWQSIDGRVASVNDLREVPVLFISGRDQLRLSPRQKDALRSYVQYGGFVFAEACEGDGCGDNSGFDRDFRDLMTELFPDTEMQLLDQSHPVFSAQYELPVNPDWPLYGIQSSCRTSVIYCQRNLAGFWRVNRPSFQDALTVTARTQMEYATRLGVNVITYATGRVVQDKLQQPQMLDVAFEGPGERVVMIPKLAHGGNADAAPNAWQNIMRRASFDLKQRFKIDQQMISPQIETLRKYPMIFMHGRAAFRWSDEERQALREYLTGFGFLFADSICSSKAFESAFRREMEAIFPEYRLQTIPSTDPMWSDASGGYQLDQVSMHEPASELPGGVRRLRTAPLMQGIQHEGRWIVVFSPHDLSCAMENGAETQCPGYDRDDAARLGVNIILSALQPPE